MDRYAPASVQSFVESLNSRFPCSCLQGYEDFVSRIPTYESGYIPSLIHPMMEMLARKVQANNFQINHNFARRILSSSRCGALVMLGLWKKGFGTPPHTHSPGFMHEILVSGVMQLKVFELIEGKYKLVDTAILQPMSIIYSGPITKQNPNPHQLIAVEDCVSLHFTTEVFRDGKGNSFDEGN